LLDPYSSVDEVIIVVNEFVQVENEVGEEIKDENRHRHRHIIIDS
jgi:hypothetical protein